MNPRLFLVYLDRPASESWRLFTLCLHRLTLQLRHRAKHRHTAPNPPAEGLITFLGGRLMEYSLTPACRGHKQEVPAQPEAACVS